MQHDVTVGMHEKNSQKATANNKNRREYDLYSYSILYLSFKNSLVDDSCRFVVVKKTTPDILLGGRKYLVSKPLMSSSTSLIDIAIALF
jgi:hypothetical protein